MPRRSSGGRSSARSAPRPAPARSAPPPQTVNHAPPPAPVQGRTGGSMPEDLATTIAHGLAFSTGSAVARRVVEAVMAPLTIQHEHVGPEAAAAPAQAASINGFSGSDACNIHSKAFQDCVSNFGSQCQFYMDMLTECRRNSGSVMSAFRTIAMEYQLWSLHL